LVADLRQRADLRGQTTRHPDSDLKRSLVQSLRSLRALVTRSGGSFFLTATAPTALPIVPPTTGEQFLEVAWPSTALSIHGVDVLVGSIWCPLSPVPFAGRRDYQGGSDRPRAYVVRTLPSETPDTTLSAGAIQIYPLDLQGLQYRIWFLPELTEVVTGTHVVQGYDGDWLEWVLWDSTIKYAAEDDDVQNVDGIASRERAIVQERMVATLQIVQSAEPITPRRHRSYR
jgi:hypothetical protein